MPNEPIDYGPIQTNEALGRLVRPTASNVD